MGAQRIGGYLHAARKTTTPGVRRGHPLGLLSTP